MSWHIFLSTMSWHLSLNPYVAIIDECFSNMDEQTSNKIIQLIKKEYSNTYFLFTSHRKTEIDFFGADTRLLMRKQRKGGQPHITLQEDSK